MLHPYTVKAGAQIYRIWATSACAAICQAITVHGCMRVSARRAA